MSPDIWGDTTSNGLGHLLMPLRNMYKYASSSLSFNILQRCRRTCFSLRIR